MRSYTSYPDAQSVSALISNVEVGVWAVSWTRTSASLWQLGDAKQRIIARDRLKRDVRVPLALLALPLAALQEAREVQLFGRQRRDDADLVILVQLAARVVDGVDVQLGGGRLARELAEALDELLLEVVGYFVLLAEEDDSTLGYWL